MERTREAAAAEPVGAAMHWLLVPLCLLGILVANAYSLLITNHGLLLAGVFPSLEVLGRQLPETWATFVFAAALQVGILVLYVTLALTRPRERVLLLPFLGAMVAVSFYFGFLSVHANARGEGYRDGLANRLERVEARIAGEERFMAEAVSRALAGYQALAQASRRGEDKTGVARCGPICQGHYDRAERIRARFGHFLDAPSPPAPSSRDLGQRWSELSEAHARYRARTASFEAFLEATDARGGYAPDSSLEAEFASLSRLFDDGADDLLSLTAASLRRIVHDQSVAVSATISILPDVINVSLAMAMSGLLAVARVRRLARSRRPAPPRALRWDAPRRPADEVIVGDLAALSQQPNPTPAR